MPLRDGEGGSHTERCQRRVASTGCTWDPRLARDSESSASVPSSVAKGKRQRVLARRGFLSGHREDPDPTTCRVSRGTRRAFPPVLTYAALCSEGCPAHSDQTQPCPLRDVPLPSTRLSS